MPIRLQFLLAAGADPRLRHDVAIKSATYYGPTHIVRVVSEPFVGLRAPVATQNQQQTLRRRASSGGEYAIGTGHQMRERVCSKSQKMDWRSI